MREIKFRVWSICVGIWSQNIFPIVSGQPVTIDGDNDDYIFEQFTGLHDKNGREIYEGDVIMDVDAEPENRPFFPVEWNCKQGAWCAGDMCFGEDFKYWQVIGNIHENRELLA